MNFVLLRMVMRLTSEQKALNSYYRLLMEREIIEGRMRVLEMLIPVKDILNDGRFKFKIEDKND